MLAVCIIIHYKKITRVFVIRNSLINHLKLNNIYLCAGQIVLPPSPSGSLGVRRKICVIKKGGALENEVKIGQGTGK